MHCFEIVPETFARLRKRLDDIAPRVMLSPFGSLDANGTVDVFVSEDSLISSIYERTDALAKRRRARLRAVAEIMPMSAGSSGSIFSRSTWRAPKGACSRD